MIFLISPSFQLCKCTTTSFRSSLKYFLMVLLNAKKLMLSDTAVSNHLWFDLKFYGDVGFWFEINLHLIREYFLLWESYFSRHLIDQGSFFFFFFPDILAWFLLSSIWSWKKVKVKAAPSCLTLCDLMDCSPPDSSVHGILQTRTLEWVAVSFSRGSSWSKDRTRVSHIAIRFCTIWTTREAHLEFPGFYSQSSSTGRKQSDSGLSVKAVSHW